MIYIYIVAEITFKVTEVTSSFGRYNIKVAVITSSMANITFVLIFADYCCFLLNDTRFTFLVAEIIFKEAVITSSVVTISSVGEDITFEVADISLLEWL